MSLLLLANVHPSYGSVPSMMPPDEVRRVARRLIQRSSWKRNSRKFAVTSERQFGLQDWRSLRTRSLPARIEGKFVGFAARDCYEQWRLATLQLPEKFSKERQLP